MDEDDNRQSEYVSGLYHMYDDDETYLDYDSEEEEDDVDDNRSSQDHNSSSARTHYFEGVGFAQSSNILIIGGANQTS